MRKTLLSIVMLCAATFGFAQFGGGFGGFGGFQAPQTNLETSQEWKDVNYVGDDQVYHTCDIYLPKQEKESYPVVIHIYGSAWFSNNSKGAADLGTIVKALLNAGYAVVCPNHRSSEMPHGLHSCTTSVPSSASFVVRPRSTSSTPHSSPPADSLQVDTWHLLPPLPAD